jgi:hypothetical protein
MNLPDFTFQQDNDPKYTLVFTKEYFTDRRIKVMTWPAQSPGMNPIEHFWDFLKKKK